VVDLFENEEALRRTNAAEITELTRRATAATYYADGLAADDLEFIERVVRISAESAASAAQNPNQHFLSIMLKGALAGFVIATVHSEDSRELDWLMLDPCFHGSGIADQLIRPAMAWLGEDRPMWLNVVRHNERAIRFYRRYGFEIDPEAVCPHVMPHWIMRRG